VARDGFPNLCWSLAKLGLLVSKEALFGAGGTLSAVQALKTTAQAGMAQGAVAAAIAGKLIGHAGDFGHLLVDMDLPGIAEVFAGELVTGKNRRESRDFERRGRMIGRNFVGRICKLGVAACGEREDAECNEATVHGELFHGDLSRLILSRFMASRESGSGKLRGNRLEDLAVSRTKKDGTNILLFVPGGQ
jgi:hypothetical protein